MTDEPREPEPGDADDSVEIPTRIDAQALTFDPSLAASSPTSITVEDMRVGLADLDEDLRTMTQNNHEVERWRRLSTRGLERAQPASGNEDPSTEEHDLSDITDVNMRPISRDAYRPPPMPQGEPDTVEQSLDEPALSSTSPGLLKAEDTPLPRPASRASRSFGAPREVPSRTSDISLLQPEAPSADRTAPFQTLPAQLLARARAEETTPQPASARQSQPASDRPSARPVFVPRPSSIPVLDVPVRREDLTPTQFVRSPLAPTQEPQAPEAEVAGVPQSYVVAALLAFALLIILGTWWVVR